MTCSWHDNQQLFLYYLLTTTSLTYCSPLSTCWWDPVYKSPVPNASSLLQSGLPILYYLVENSMAQEVYTQLSVPYSICTQFCVPYCKISMCLSAVPFVNHQGLERNDIFWDTAKSVWWTTPVVVCHNVYSALPHPIFTVRNVLRHFTGQGFGYRFKTCIVYNTLQASIWLWCPAPLYDSKLEILQMSRSWSGPQWMASLKQFLGSPLGCQPHHKCSASWKSPVLSRKPWLTCSMTVTACVHSYVLQSTQSLTQYVPVGWLVYYTVLLPCAHRQTPRADRYLSLTGRRYKSSDLLYALRRCTEYTFRDIQLTHDEYFHHTLTNLCNAFSSE